MCPLFRMSFRIVYNSGQMSVLDESLPYSPSGLLGLHLCSVSLTAVIFVFVSLCTSRKCCPAKKKKDPVIGSLLNLLASPTQQPKAQRTMGQYIMLHPADCVLPSVTSQFPEVSISCNLALWRYSRHTGVWKFVIGSFVCIRLETRAYFCLS